MDVGYIIWIGESKIFDEFIRGLEMDQYDFNFDHSEIGIIYGDSQVKCMHLLHKFWWYQDIYGIWNHGNELCDPGKL